MNHVENPLIWKLFFLVAGLSSVAAFTAVVGREAIWRPRDTFDKAFQWAFRALGASAFVSVLVFCYAVTERCVVAENECQVYKSLAISKGPHHGEGIAFESGRDQGNSGDLEYTTTTVTGRTISIRSRPMSAGDRRAGGADGRTGDVPGFMGTPISGSRRSSAVLPDRESRQRPPVKF